MSIDRPIIDSFEGDQAMEREPTASRKRLRLNYSKCDKCRADKKKCAPLEREWPERCDRCVEKDLPCSENISLPRKRRLRAQCPSATRRVADDQENVAGYRVHHEERHAAIATPPHTQLSSEEQQRPEPAPDTRTFPRIPSPSLYPPRQSFAQSLRSYVGHPAPPNYFPPWRGSGLHFYGGQAMNLHNVNAIRDDELFDLSLHGERPTVLSAQYRGPLQMVIREVISIPPQPMSSCSHTSCGQAMLHSTVRKKSIIHGLEDTEAACTGWKNLVVPALNSEEAVNAAIKNGVDLDTRNSDKETALHLAVSSGNDDLVRCLIKAGASCSTMRNKVGATPLHHAARSGNLGIVRQLLEMNSDPDDSRPFDWTPLHEAADKGHAAVVELMVRGGAAINARDDDGETPLLVAIRSAEEGFEGVVSMLLGCGANPDIPSYDGETPLMRSAQYCHYEMLSMLLSSNPTIDAQDNCGWTALHHAILSDFGDGLENAKMLVRANASLDIRNQTGRSPLDFVMENPDIAKFARRLQRLRARTLRAQEDKEVAVLFGSSVMQENCTGTVGNENSSESEGSGTQATQTETSSDSESEDD